MTALNQILSGSRLLAAAAQGIAPLAALKGTDQSYATTTLGNDSALFLSCAANAGYFFFCYLDYEGGTQGSSDLKWQWTAPSGSTLSMSFIAYPTSGGVGANVNIGAITGLSTPRAIGTDGGVKLGALMFGSLIIGSTAGDFQLQAAQNTSSATATIIHAGSVLAGWQVQ